MRPLLYLLAATLLHASVSAQPAGTPQQLSASSPAPSAAIPNTTVARSRAIYEAATAARQAMVGGDRAGARRLLDAVEPLARSEWSLESLIWWYRQTELTLGVDWLASNRTWTRTELEAVMSPTLTHFSQTGADGQIRNIEAHVYALFSWITTLLSVGDDDARAEGQALAITQSKAWIQALAADPADAAKALRYLDAWAKLMYGAFTLGEVQDDLAARLRLSLGPGHRITLRVMKAQVFRLRRLQRWNDALALTDDYARMVDVHQGGDPALKWSNVSERIGALSGVGRYADALAEGQAMVAWMASQPTTPYTSLMRVHGMLAQLSIDIADANLAVHHGQAAVRYSGAIERPADYPEARFARLALHSARVFRGDAGAEQDLQQTIEEIGAKDIDLGHADLMLWQRARTLGDLDRAQWAEAFSAARAEQGNHGPTDASRVRPVLLRAMARPTGDADAVPAAARAMAYGLTGRDTALRIAGQFELARHMAASAPQGAAWLYKRGADDLLRWRSAAGTQDSTALPSWLTGYGPALRAYVDLLIDQGRLAEVQQALEVLQGEELADFRRRSRGLKRQAINRAEADAGLSFTRDEQARNAALAPLAQTLREQADAADHRVDRSRQAHQRRGAQDQAFEQAMADAAVRAVELARVPSMVPTIGPTAPQANMPATVAPMALPRGTVQVTYWVQPKQLVLLVHKDRQVRQVRVPVDSGDLNRAVHALRLALQRPDADARPQAQALHRWLIAPVQPWLAGTDTLRLVVDASLRYVPFGALHDGRQYLVERHALAVDFGAARAVAPATDPAATGPKGPDSPTSSGSAVNAASATPLLAAFGRTEPDERHSALPGVEREIGQLSALRGARVVPAIDQAFTAQALRAGLAQRPTVVHLASHFVLDPAGEEQSYLLLGDGQRLSLRQLRELSWQSVELALLSACESALALDAHQGGAEGRALFGFAQALRDAGARQVMATLWRIDDAATAQWMGHFYAPWRQAGARQPIGPQWLARAQRSWLQAHRGSSMAHPHYWAAFSWMGG